MNIMPLFNKTVVGGANFTTGPLTVTDFGNFSFGVTITGSDVVGTIQIQAAYTIDFARPYLVQAATAITASADTLINVSDVNYPYVRLVWTYTSGTGDVSVDAAIRIPMIGKGA